MSRRPSRRPESASTLIGGGILAIVVGAILFAVLAADGFDLGGSGRALWGFIMAPLGVVMLIAGIVKRSREMPQQRRPSTTDGAATSHSPLDQPRRMIRLALPSQALRESWLASIAEFEGATLHGHATFRFDELDLGDDAVFAAWLAREERLRTHGEGDLVPGTCWWIVDDQDPARVLGSIHLRHELNARLLADGGHVGYGIRPSERGRGVATAALAACIDEARGMGIERLLLVCDADNPASRRTILTAGGVLEDAPGAIERYWIQLSPAR